MKKLLLLLPFTFTFALTSFGQATFSSPESVEFDQANNRWIVGNNATGTVVFYYPSTATTVQFASGLATGPHGIETMGGDVYVCDGAFIRGYSLATGANNFNLNLGATFLNGITTDGSNYLFVTDFSAKKIYRVNPAANTFNLMCSTGTSTPNGIIYDGANNRCVFVCWGSNAPIKAMSLADSTISTCTTTTLSNCDGITRDNAGYWYVTNWGANSLVRFTPTFTTPTTVMTGLSSPADIDINTAGDSIGIPNNGNLSNVVFYTGITTGLNNNSISPEFSFYPNPATIEMNISFNIHFTGAMEIYSADGNLVRSEMIDGVETVENVSQLAEGTYIIRLRDANNVIVSSKEFQILR